MKRREARMNPVWVSIRGIDVNSWFSKSICMSTHTYMSYSASLRGSGSSKTPTARNTLNSYVLVSKCNSQEREPMLPKVTTYSRKGQGKHTNRTEPLIVSEKKEALGESWTVSWTTEDSLKKCPLAKSGVI